ncbi:uncharacterized protein [Maniola hyperantus]|uniref:uncharacterized protein n=1 Tax=Aphantopus hyperantus TaxID=2795564 RepID=UPI00212C1537
MPDDKKNTGTYKKCINCSLRLLFVPKIMLNDLNESLLEILKAWISPTTITVDDCICMECYHVLNQAVGQTDPQNKPLRGHRSVCYGCGASTLRTRTSLLKYPERSIVMEWTFPHLVNKLERVCPACRLAARRIAIKNGLLDRPIVKKTGLHDEKEMSSEPEFEIKQEFIQEFRSESPCTDTELTNECTISQTENDFTARIASQVKNTSHSFVFCPNSANIDTEGKNESPLNPQTENAPYTITTSEESFFNSDIDENESISRITPQQFDSNSFDSDTESENEYVDDLFIPQAENVPVVARSTSQELDSISQHSDTELKNEYIAPPIPQAESDPQVARIASQELLSNSHENVSLARIDSQEFNSNFLHSDTELKNRYRAPLIPQAENNPAVVRIKLQKFISSQNGIKMVPLTKMAAQGLSASKNAIKVGPFARFTLQESNSSSQNRIKIVPVGRIPSQEFNSSSQSGIKIVAKASTQEFNSNSPYAEKNVPTARINKVYTECSSLPRTENSTVERIISSQNGIKIVPVDRIPSQEFNSSSQSGIKIVAKARTQEFNSNSPYAVNVPIARVNKVYAGCSSLPQTENSTVGRVISKRYKRVADTYNRCIFTNCAKEDCFNVPVSLKKTLLSQYKVYIPLSARMCSYHLNYGVWGDLIATNSDFTGQQMDDMMNIMQCG